MAKVFCIDVSKCSGCYNCQFACKDEHCGNEWMPISRMQPLTGQFWLKMQENIQGSRPKIKMHYIPLLCNHCDDPACMRAGKDGAVYKRADGLVIIDPERSKDQKQIMSACPYGAVYWNEELSIPQKCTGCAHLVDEGLTPRCVDVCHTGALRFGDKEEFTEFIRDARVMRPETAAGPNVYYKGIPGQFIAGTVYDPVEEETVRGAVCTLKSRGLCLKTETDVFGDFWFKDLKEDIYELSIEAEGFKSLNFSDLNASESINLGDIPMEKEQGKI